MKVHLVISLALAVIMVLALACGSADEEEAPAAEAPAATTAPAAAKPVATMVPYTVEATATPIGGATQTEEEAKEAQEVTLGIATEGLWSFDPTGLENPSSFQEAPMLAARVASGDLPPLAERLPPNPFIHRVVESIGEYGGTWRRAFTGPRDGQNYDRINHDQHFLFDIDGISIYPHIAKGWDINADFTEFTIFLREGVKWSDGSAHNADDFVFGVEHINYNETINPGRNKKLAYTSFAPEFEKIDDMTVRFTMPESTPYFTDQLPGCGGGCGFGGWTLHARVGNSVVAPAEFAKKYHADFAEGGEEAVTKAAKDAGFDDWASYFKEKSNPNRNPDSPMFGPWKVVSSITTPLWEYERNPYYFGVDQAGNQLPYIDFWSATLTEDTEVLNLKAIAGEFDMQGRHIEFARLPVYKQNEEKGDYTVVLTPTTPGDGLVWNQTWVGDAEVEKWVQNKDFRLALALGLDREEFRQALKLGQGGLGHNLPKEDHPWFQGEEMYTKNATFDKAKGNEILDSLGLTEKDADGNRLRSDGSGKPLVLECYTISRAATDDFVELIAAQWTENLGIKTTPKPVSRSNYEGLRSADDMMIDCIGTHISPRSIPNVTWPFQALGGKYGTWYQSEGSEGVEPPEGPYRRLQDIYVEANKLRVADRKTLYEEGWGLYIDNVMGTGVNRHYPSHMIVIKNNTRNVLLTAPPQYQYPGEIHLDQMYFVGGKNSAGF